MVESRRRALVTGGGVRVGRSICLGLADAGYDVAVHHHTSGEEAQRVARRVRRAEGRSLTVAADLTDPESIPGMMERVARRFGGIDLLVNNAAAFPRARPEEVTLEQWNAVFALNVRAPFFCAVAAREHMPAEGASIVNIADVAAFEAWSSYAPYAATKAALVNLTRSLARAWAPGLRVNAVAPGPVLLPEGTSRSVREETAARTALGRVGKPSDVAEAVLYLDRAEFVTGEVLRVDGGENLMRGVAPTGPE